MIEEIVPAITKYYGADWGGMICSALCVYLLGKKKKEGFLVGIVANCSWMAFGIMAGSIANIVANIGFIILNGKGYLNWKKEKSEPISPNVSE